MNEKGFEFNFALFFAILAGAVILFLAIYFSSSLVKTSTYKINTITAKQLGIIFEPMETGFASAKKAATANFKDETRIYNQCYSDGAFGHQGISLASKTLKKWSSKSTEIRINNKYIFSEDIIEGKNLYFFSKPFNMPWKVSEVIFLTSSSYCFINAPENIADEVQILGLENIKIENCSKEDIGVCFSSYSDDCKIKVIGLGTGEEEYNYGFVTKDGESIYYSGSLIYGAILSSKNVYDCNVKRLMKRLLQQALIYEDESRFLSGICGTAQTISMVNAARNADSENLGIVDALAKEVDKQNEAAECKLW